MNITKPVTILFVLLCVYGCVTPKERPINELPMYGNKPKSEGLIKNDQQFIDWAIGEFGTRQLASEDAAARGWRAFYENDLKTAIYRFNQAWLLNPDNAEAFWGFGIIMGRRAETEDTEHNLRESIRFLELANTKSPNNARVLADLAFSNTILGYYLKENGRPESALFFGKADDIFTRAAIEPEYPVLHSQWSVLEFYKGDFHKAKERLDLAVKFGDKPDPTYVRELETKLND